MGTSRCDQGGIAAPYRPNRHRIAPCVSASNLFRHPACPPGGSPARHSLVELNEAAEIQESQGRAAPAFRDSALALSLDMIGDGNRKVRPALAPPFRLDFCETLLDQTHLSQDAHP